MTALKTNSIPWEKSVITKKTELKTLECDILNPDRLINLEINKKRRTSIIKSGDSEKEWIKH